MIKSFRTIFFGCKTLKMTNFRYRDILFETIVYGCKALNMANSIYGGYNTENYALWMKRFKSGKFQI